MFRNQLAMMFESISKALMKFDRIEFFRGKLAVVSLVQQYRY